MLGLILACGTLGFFFENICGIKQRYRRRPQRHEEDERRGNVRRRGGQQNKGPGEGAIWSTSRHRQPTGYVCPRPFSSAVATGLGVLSSPFSYLTLLQARQTWDSLSFCRSTRCMNTVSITHGACACVPVHHPVCLSVCHAMRRRSEILCSQTGMRWRLCPATGQSTSQPHRACCLDLWSANQPH